MLEITSKENKWIKEYIRLSSSKSYREKQNLFTVESIKLVLEAFQNNVKLEMVFVTATCRKSKSQELEKLFQTQNCVEISEEIDKKLSMGKSSQGIFAICSKPQHTLSMETVYYSGRYVMLVDLQDTGNVGTIIRTAEAVGMDGIIVTKSTCDCFNPKVIRGTMGSIFRMKILVIDNEFDFLNNLQEKQVATYASVLDEKAIELSQVKFPSSFVLLIGNEGNGISEQVKAVCSQMVTIKMQGNAESLNASIAAGILMYEATKNK